MGMFLAYIAFYYGNRMTMALYLEKQDAQAQQIYKYESSVQCIYKCQWEEVADCFQNIRGNVMVTGMPLYVDKMNAEHMVRIFLKQTEKKEYLFIEGGMPENQGVPDSQLCVVLGKDQKRYTERIGEKDYLSICGEKYLVTGYIRAKHSSIYDNAIFLFHNRMGENTKESVDYYASTMGAYFILQSDESDFKRENDQVLSLLAEHEVYTFPIMEYDEWFYSEVLSINYRAYAYLAYLFSICMVVMVVEFWILQRKTEIAIRRIDGFSNIQIIGLIAREIAGILFATGGVILITQIILNLIHKDDFTITKMMVYLAAALLFIFVTFILLMIYPFVKIMRGNIADVIKEGR